MTFTIWRAARPVTWSWRGNFILVATMAWTLVFCLVDAAIGGVAFNYSPAGTIGGGSRWDAAPRTVSIQGIDYERSLVGGLRYTVTGESFATFRNQFNWDVLPSVGAFQTAVQQAFDAWTVPDPVTGLGTSLKFVPDLSQVPLVYTGFGGGVDPRGAEIDIVGQPYAANWDLGNSTPQGETWFAGNSSTVTLTSGTANYAGSNAITGADIYINDNPGAVYSLDYFRRLLTHEIGHAIGLGDAEGSINPGAFIDDNYDGSTSATALATLTNSWALKVNPLNPGASVGLNRYFVPFADPGTTTPGVNILMESNGLGIASGNPVTNLTPLSNDEYGMRQFLYPQVRVPEPSTSTLSALIAVAVTFRRRRAILHSRERTCA
jgi:hypothetical protein